jgi:hypothetical protein
MFFICQMPVWPNGQGTCEDTPFESKFIRKPALFFQGMFHLSFFEKNSELHVIISIIAFPLLQE